jgi:integrase
LPLTAAGQYAVRDTDVRGFMVVVGKTTRTFAIQLQLTELGRPKDVRKTIARVGDLMTKEARDLARKMIGDLRTGAVRPGGDARGPTLREAWCDYRDNHLQRSGRERSPGTIANYRDHFERVLRDWLDAPLRELAERPQLVRDRHRRITEENGPYIANGCMRSLRAVYNWARKKIDRTLPPDPPVDSADFNVEQRRDTGMGPDDLASWFEQVRGLTNHVRQEFHLFTLLSGSRPGALKRARWDQLNVRQRTLHFPDPKGGAKKAFDMPLSRPMLRCLWRARRAGRQLHAEQASTFIFPAETAPGHIVEHKEDRADLCKWGNDLRQTYANMAQAAGVPLFFVKVLMNHSQGSDVTMGYVTVSALRSQALEQQERISAAILGSSERPADEAALAA